MPAVLELTLLARNAPEQDLEAICIAVVLMANGEGVFRYQFAGAFFTCIMKAFSAIERNVHLEGRCLHCIRLVKNFLFLSGCLLPAVPNGVAHSTNLEESINFGIRGSFGRKIGSSTGLDSGPEASPTAWVPASFSWNLPKLPAPQVWLGRSEAAAALQAFSNFDLMKPNKGDFPALGSPVGVAHQHGLQRKVGFGHA